MKSRPIFWKQENFLVVLLVVLAALLTHGVLISKLGFYRDDWYMLWTAHARGTSAVRELFLGDRPFLGYLYALDYLILGDAPLGWHLYALLLKILGAFSFLWLLRLIWPARRLESAVAVIFYIVYPGFFQQPNAVTYVNLLLAYFCALLSIAITLWAVKTAGPVRQVIATLLAVVLMLVYLFIYESLIGMEVVRLLLAGYVLARRDGTHWKRLLKSLVRWDILYAALAAAFAVWRLFIFESARRATNVDLVVEKLVRVPTYGLGGKLFELLRDLFETSLLAWTAPYYQFTAQVRYRDLAAGWGVSLLVVGLVVLYWLLARRLDIPTAAAGSPADGRELKAWMWIGGVIILVTSLPIVLAGRNVIFSAQFDRYTAQAVMGVALLSGGVAFTVFREKNRWVFSLLLVFLGVSTQYQSAVYYRDLWTYQKDLWWQLSWRAPGLAPGTTLIVSLPQDYQLPESYEVWGPANLIYTPGGSLQVGGQVIFDEIMAYLIQGVKIEQIGRGNLISYDYDKTLVLSIPSENACLHVQSNTPPNLYFSEPSDVVEISPYSKIDLIEPQARPVQPPQVIFGPEPSHRWCYYYQKIELANQAGQWEKAAELADEAAAWGLSPDDRSEWLPVLAAYVNSGQEDKAHQTAKKIRGERLAKIFLCNQLEQVTEWPQGYNDEMLLTVLCTTEKE